MLIPLSLLLYIAGALVLGLVLGSFFGVTAGYSAGVREGARATMLAVVTHGDNMLKAAKAAASAAHDVN